MPPPYEKHIFVCTNERPEGHPRGSCARRGGFDVRLALVKELAAKGLRGKVRANKSGCLDACEMGVAAVVYPKGTWYLGINPQDSAEIIETSIIGDGIVSRLAATEQNWAELRRIRQSEKKSGS